MEENYPLWEAICRRAPTAQDVSDYQDLFTEPIKTLSFRGLVLMAKRNYFIRVIKDPIRKALENLESVSWVGKFFLILELLKAIKKYPQVTRETAEKQNTFVILDTTDLFFKYEKVRDDKIASVPTMRALVFRTPLKLVAGGNESDNYYGSRLCWWLEELIKAVLDGRWAARPLNYPDPRHWKEPQPYGGEHTIIYAIQKNREKIIDLLGNEWAWLKEGK